jgi:site-specific recombinase XerD
MARQRPGVTTSIGTMLDQHNIRHTFVSIMLAGGVPVEEIARVAGHKQTSTTELVCRRELRPVITTGAEVMGKVFAR